jgi:hypothetical protein
MRGYFLWMSVNRYISGRFAVCLCARQNRTALLCVFVCARASLRFASGLLACLTRVTSNPVQRST